MHQMACILTTDRFTASSQVKPVVEVTDNRVELLENQTPSSAAMSAFTLKNRHSETSLPKQVLSLKFDLQ